ncbi:MAG: hypothetical protein ABUL58_05010, partial [Steroidobacter sp.]
MRESILYPYPVTDLKAFVPAGDIELSKEFYVDLRFAINFCNDEIAELQIGSFRFYEPFDRLRVSSVD